MRLRLKKERSQIFYDWINLLYKVLFNILPALCQILSKEEVSAAAKEEKGRWKNMHLTHPRDCVITSNVVKTC